jgi:hypothetical protein
MTLSVIPQVIEFQYFIFGILEIKKLPLPPTQSPAPHLTLTSALYIDLVVSENHQRQFGKSHHFRP